MTSTIIRTVLENSAFVLLLLFGLVVASFIAFREVPVDALPNIGENQVIVLTEWQGQSPQDIEDQVTYPLSSQLQGLPGVRTLRASSMFGLSMIYIVFEDDIDFYWARTRVSEELQTARSQLPPGVTPELGPDATGLGHVFWYTLEGEGYSLAQLRSIQDFYVKLRLQAVKGVSEVASVGGHIKQYQIQLDPTRLQNYSISAGDVFRAVTKSNLNLGANVIEDGSMEFAVRGLGFIESLRDIEEIVIELRDGVPVTIEHIADVTTGPAPRRGALEKNGQGEVAGGVVVMRHGENPQEVIDRVKKRLDEVKRGLPENVKIKSFYDRTELIQSALSTLSNTLILQMLITILVVFFFVHHFRSSLLVSISLPFAVLISFFLMNLFGVSANIMSLAGIIIGIGTIVDMSIVISENIARHLAEARKNGKNASTAILAGTTEVAPAVFGALATTLISFLPVFLLDGREGKLFVPLAWTKTFALGGAALAALVLIPVLSRWFLKGKIQAPSEQKFSKLLFYLYRPSLRWVLNHKKTFLTLPLFFLALSVLLYPRIGSEFMPPLNEGDILYMPVMAPGVSMTKALEVMQKQNEALKAMPEVEQVVGKVGRAETATDPAPLEMFETVINLAPKKHWRHGMTRDQLIARMDQMLDIPGVSNMWTQPISNRVDMLATGIRTQVGIKVLGDDLAVLERTAHKIAKLIRGIDGVEDVYAETVTGKPYLDIEIDRSALTLYGLSVEKVQRSIQLAVGGRTATSTVEGRERYPVVIRYPSSILDGEEGLSQILIENSQGTHIPLAQVAKLERRPGPSMINSEDGMLRTYVLFNVRQRDLKSTVIDTQQVVGRQLNLPEGTSLEWGGEYEHQLSAQRQLSWIVPLVLLINLLIIYFLFRSWAHTFLVFSAIPVAMAGGLIFLWLSGYHLSVAVWVGFIALFGIAVDDGLVMMSYLRSVFRQKQAEGSLQSRSEIREAVLEAGLKRVRPMVMTTLTTIFALIPVFIVTGTGSDVMRPMAIPSMGGMLIAMLSMFVVPALFCWLHENKLES